MDRYDSDYEYEQNKRNYLKGVCSAMAPKLNILCISTIIGIVIAVINVILAFAYGLGLKIAFFGLLAFLFLAFVNCMVYGIVLCTMKGQDNGFMTAGITYIVYQILYSAGNGIFSYFWFGKLAQIVSFIFGLIFILSFVGAMNEILLGVDNYLAESWMIFKKYFSIALIATIVCVILAYVPIIKILAAIGLIISMIALLVLFIWQIILLFKTKNAMQNI